MDINMADQSQIEDDCERQNRIKMYKSILNYYKGRSLSLDFVLECKQPRINFPPEMRTMESLHKHIQGLHDDIILIQSMKNCLKLIHSSLASTEVMSVNASNFRSESLNKIEGIIYFSKSIMKLYSECPGELEVIEKMKTYSTALSDYINSLKKLKEQESNGTDEDSKEMEKAEAQVYKINLMRTMKSVLIGYVSLNCPSLLRSVKNFKTSLRRNLTVDDFRDTWDVGLSS